MPKKPKRDRQATPPEQEEPVAVELGVQDDDADESRPFRVQDRRHWAEEREAEPDEESSVPKQPTLIDEFRARAESAEQKLQEYIDAFKRFKAEHEEFRERLNRDVDRRVELKFGELVSELLDSVDDLDLALEHSSQVPEAEPLAQGVELARKRFLGVLERHGVSRVIPDGEEFDPNEAEAVRVDPVDSAERNHRVTETIRPGYRLGERVIRAARVAVGRYGGR
jgi:molecular chaperone GrpE